jgi:hypothetical protein
MIWWSSVIDMCYTLRLGSCPLSRIDTEWVYEWNQICRWKKYENNWRLDLIGMDSMCSTNSRFTRIRRVPTVSDDSFKDECFLMIFASWMCAKWYASLVRGHDLLIDKILFIQAWPRAHKYKRRCTSRIRYIWRRAKSNKHWTPNGTDMGISPLFRAMNSTN